MFQKLPDGAYTLTEEALAKIKRNNPKIISRAENFRRIILRNNEFYFLFIWTKFFTCFKLNRPIYSYFPAGILLAINFNF